MYYNKVGLEVCPWVSLFYECAGSLRVQWTRADSNTCISGYLQVPSHPMAEQYLGMTFWDASPHQQAQCKPVVQSVGPGCKNAYDSGFCSSTKIALVGDSVVVAERKCA